MDEQSCNQQNMEGYYSSDDDVAWGPVTINEIKRDFKSDRPKKSRRETFAKDPNMHDSFTCVIDPSSASKKLPTKEELMKNWRNHSEVPDLLKDTSDVSINCSLDEPPKENFISKVAHILSHDASGASSYIAVPTGDTIIISSSDEEDSMDNLEIEGIIEQLDKDILNENQNYLQSDNSTSTNNKESDSSGLSYKTCHNFTYLATHTRPSALLTNMYAPLVENTVILSSDDESSTDYNSFHSKYTSDKDCQIVNFKKEKINEISDSSNSSVYFTSNNTKNVTITSNESQNKTVDSSSRLSKNYSFNEIRNENAISNSYSTESTSSQNAELSNDKNIDSLDGNDYKESYNNNDSLDEIGMEIFNSSTDSTDNLFTNIKENNLIPADFIKENLQKSRNTNFSLAEFSYEKINRLSSIDENNENILYNLESEENDEMIDDGIKQSYNKKYSDEKSHYSDRSNNSKDKTNIEDFDRIEYNEKSNNFIESNSSKNATNSSSEDKIECNNKKSYSSFESTSSKNITYSSSKDKINFEDFDRIENNDFEELHNFSNGNHSSKSSNSEYLANDSLANQSNLKGLDTSIDLKQTYKEESDYSLNNSSNAMDGDYKDSGNFEFNDTLEEMELLLQRGLDYSVSDQYVPSKHKNEHPKHESESVYRPKPFDRQNSVESPSRSADKYSTDSDLHYNLHKPKSASKIPKKLNNTPVQSPKEFAKFKVPVKPTPKKATATKTPLSKAAFKNIKSPVSVYIKNSPTVPLKQNVQSKPISKLVITNSVKTDTFKSSEKENSFQLPEVIYKPSKKPVVLKKEQHKLPDSIQKHIPAANIIKHEGRLQNSQKPINTILNRRLLDSTANMSDFSLLNNSQDVSLLTIKQALIE